MKNLETSCTTYRPTATHSDCEGPSLLCQPDEVSDGRGSYLDDELEFLDAEFTRQMANDRS